MNYAVYALIAVAAVGALYRLLFARVVVREYQGGLLYRRGRLARRVGAGVYHIFRWWSELCPEDMRATTVTVPGQEVLSADNVGLKVSTAVSYEIQDLERALHSVQSYSGELYLAVQLALRSIVAERSIDDILSQRLEIGQELLARVFPRAEEIGLRVHSVAVKDVMFPGDLKKTFAEVVRAQKQGQAALEQARGETAALRNLANAARMLEKNPALLQLRTLHTISGLAGQGGVTVVLGLPPGANPALTGGAEPADPEPSQDEA